MWKISHDQADQKSQPSDRTVFWGINTFEIDFFLQRLQLGLFPDIVVYQHLQRGDDFKIKAYRPAVRGVLTPHHMRERLAWCQARVHWNHHQWRHVMFTDESRFYLQPQSRRQRVYRRQGERYIAECILQRDSHRGGSVMIWGGITFDRKTDFLICQGNITAQRYIDQIVTPRVLPFIQGDPNIITFQQDNARPHVARLTMDYLRQNNIQTIPWPARSPDLNVIEHLWDELDRRVRDRVVQPRTLLELSNALQQEWNRVPQYTIRRLVSSMRRRCQAVIAAQGGHTRY